MIKTKRERFLDELFEANVGSIECEDCNEDFFANSNTVEELSNGRGDDEDDYLEAEPSHYPES